MKQNNLTQINEGGKHEENPLGGVPMGRNNSVEQNETIKNGFVYSDRIILNKDIIGQYGLPKSLTNKTVADATKFIDNKFKGRNDKISTSTRDNMLSKIAEAQEAMKPQEAPQRQMFMGGELDATEGVLPTEGAEGMNPYVSAGTKMLPSLLSGDKNQMITAGVETGFTAAGTAIGGPVGGQIGSSIGKAVSPMISKMLNKNKEQDLAREKAVISNSAFTNDFAYGGKMYAGGGPLDSLGPVPLADDLIKPTTLEEIQAYQLKNNIAKQGDKGFGTFGPKTTAQFELDKKNWSPEIPDTSSLISGNRWDKEINPGILDNKIIDSTIDPLEYSLNKDTLKDPYKLPKANLSKLGDTLGQAARYAPIAMNAYQLSQLEKPQYERLNRLDARFKPEYVDERSLQNIAGNEYDNTVNAITQMGGGEGATRNAILGAGLNKTKALSDAYMNASGQNRQMNVSGQQFNLGVDQANLQQANSELDINDRNQAAYRNAKREYLTGIGEGIGDVGKEEIYKKIAKTTTGYSWLGEFQKMNPNATKEETIIAAKKAGVVIDDDKTAKKQALGGYLIKNKRK